MTTEKKYLDIPFEIKAEDIKEDGTFEGWGSLFDNEPDAYRDLVARGAFEETLAKGGRNETGIAMLYQHRPDKVVGVWLSLREEPKGLRVKGQLAIETQIGREVYEIMLLGVKTGVWKFSLSIGYDTLEYEEQTVKIGDAKIKVRLLKKVDLWEISIVTFPAKLGATITTVKQIKEAKTVREIEDALRDSGLSKKEAQQVIAVCKEALRDSRIEEEEIQEDNVVLSAMLDSLKTINKQIELNGITDILESLQEINT